MARFVAIGSRLPAQCQAGIDQPRIVGPERLVAETQAGQDAGAIVFDDNIGRRYERLDDGLRVRIADVEHDRALVASEDIGFAERQPCRLVESIPAENPGLLFDLARIFDADDFSSHVGQQPGAIRSWQEPREVDHPDARQSAAHAASHPVNCEASTGFFNTRAGASIAAEWKSGPGSSVLRPSTSSVTDTKRPRARR